MNRLIIFSLAIIVSGCANYPGTIDGGPRSEFKSAKTPTDLAVCIDRNGDNFSWGSARSKIIDIRSDPIEVVVINGSSHYAVVKVSAAAHGSIATLYLGGVANMTPEASVDFLTKGCG